MRDVDPRAVVEACHLAIDIAFGRLEVIDGMVFSPAAAKRYREHPLNRGRFS